VIAASLYIIVCSTRNRVRMRLRRLREPRYLIGAVVGAAYLYFTFFARMRARRPVSRRRGSGAGDPPAVLLSTLRAAGAGLVGTALLLVSAVAWVMPFNSGLLEFSPAEVQFLFPAPVTRRALLVHRMLRSQLGLLFGGLIMAVAAPSTSPSQRLRVGMAMWLLLSVGKVYFTGVSLARARITSPDRPARRAAVLPLAAVLAAVGIAALAVARALTASPIAGMQDLVTRVAAATSTGAAGVVLWPFAAVARPLFADAPRDFLVALAMSALVLTAVVVWVLQTDAAFEDAAATAAERKAVAATPRAAAYKARSGISLALRGRVEGLFAWKAATQTLRIVDRIVLVRLVAIVAVLTVVSSTAGRGNGLATIVGTFAAAATAFIIMMAPQVLRVDLRDDLRHLELLKTWPVDAAAVIRGQLLWPALLLTASAWATLAVAEVLVSATPFARLSVAWRLSAGAAVAILAPALVAAQLTIHNAAAVMFPAWVPLGHQRPRGLDAMGQRLIMLGATWLLLIVGVVPGAVAALIVWLPLQLVLGAAAVVPAALCCAAVVAAEVLLATEALGPAYDALDATSVDQTE
jgi:putative ABC exporter